MREFRIAVFAIAVLLTGCAKAVPAPVADAGADQSVNTGTVVRLDGSASHDPGGRMLRFEWRFLAMPDGSSAGLNDPALARPSFTPDVDGEFVLGLRADNGIKRSAEDTVTITVGSGAPTAVIDPPASVNTGSVVQLSGAASNDPDGHPMYFGWTLTALPAGSAAALIGPETATPSFIPDLAGSYRVSLTVYDDYGNRSAPAETVVTVSSGKPSAVISPPANVRTGTTVSIAAAAIDPDQHLLRFQWSFASTPAGSFADLLGSDTASPSFIPDLPGDYVVRLVVDDGPYGNESDPATAVVSVGTGQPTAVIDPPLSVNTGTVASLSAAGSSDPDGHLLRFAWGIAAAPAGSTAALFGADTAAPSLVPDVPGDYVVRLVVYDDFGNVSAPVSAVVAAGDGSPTASITPTGAINATAGTPVQLSGATSSDPDGHLLQYQWSFVALPSGSEATLNDPATVDPTFMPDAPGDYVVRLVVHDGEFGNESVPADKIVSVTGDCTPTANAGADLLGDQLETVQLSGSASASPCGRTLQYAWAFTSIPASSATALNDAALPNPAFIADEPGTYTLALVVTDSKGLSSAADTVLVTIGSCVPMADPLTPIAGKLQGELVQLTGGTPSEPCGLAVTTWRWSFSSRPAGSLAQLSDPGDPNPTFLADEPGSYVLKLDVTNSGGLTSPLATVDVPSVGSCVPVPSIAADSAFTVDGETVRLGDTSTSPCGRSLSPEWKIVSTPSGSGAVLTDPLSKTPAFLADLPGGYVLRLVVTDSAGIESPDATVTIGAARRRADVADTGSHSSLALRGASQRPAVSYYDATEGDLKYAEYDGANWLTELVDLPGDVGRYNAVALTPDADALPRIAYWDAGNDDLKYAERDAAGNWGTVTVDAGDLEDGRYASLALDPVSGKPRIAYQARVVGGVTGTTRRILKYAYCDAADCLAPANWTKVVLVDAPDDDVRGVAARIAIAPDGAPRFSHYDATNGELYFGGCATSTCASVTQRKVDGPDVGSESDLVLNAVGNPRLAYYDATNGNAKFASCGDGTTAIDCTDAAATWSTRTLETTGDTGRQPSIALAPGTEDPRIAWQDRTRKVARYAQFSGATGLWTSVDLIGDAGDSDRGLSLVLTANGNPRVSYYADGAPAERRASFFRRGD